MSSQLSTRFNNHMTLRDFSPKTKYAYIRAVEGLCRFYNRSPDELNNDEIQTYLLHLIEEKKLAWSTCNVAFSGLRCFYLHVLKRDETDFHLPSRRRQRTLPLILSRDEVRRILEALNNPKHRALLKAVYGAGLRVSEVVRLKPCHIESDRMLIRVEKGKGKKDRYTTLSSVLLDELRIYWKACRPGPWLFFGKDRDKPMPVDSAQGIYHKAKKKAGITKAGGIHMLRHCFATHMIEAGVDIYSLKRMLGHTALVTTAGYIHVTEHRIASVKSPLDFLHE